jgi:hypothetical protein
LLAGAHLKGVGKGGLIDFLTQGKNGQDAYGTGVSEYIFKFGNYSTPFIPKEYNIFDPSEINNTFLDLTINTDKLKGFSSDNNSLDQTGNVIGVAMVCDGINFYKEGVGVIGFCLTVSNCNARTCFVVDFDTAGFWFDVFVEGYSDFCG